MVKSNIVYMSAIDRHNFDPTESAVNELAIGAMYVGEGTARFAAEFKSGT
jgi:hypothetical protein